MRALVLSLTVAAAVTSCGDDDGRGDAAGSDTGGPVTGCADATVSCPTGQICCSGVPYPTEGICQVDCPAVSDRDRKRDVRPVDGDEVLAKLAALEVSEWSYRTESGVRHVGPMAQDFHAAFGLGADDRSIHPVDACGVTIAALQALERRVAELEEQAGSPTP